MALAQSESDYRRLTTELTKFTRREPVNFSGLLEVVDSDADPIEFGGVFDPRTRRYLSAADEPGVSWEVGEQQVKPLMFYENRPGARFVLVGAMGAGKTEILVRAAAKLGTCFRNANIGMVSPTQQKMGIVWKKFKRIVPHSWILDESRRPLFEPPYIELVNGVKYQFLSAKAPSKQMGSPIHGWDWVAAFVDEEEQINDEAMHDTLSRGRDAPDGWYPVLSTCTISDDPEFRKRYAQYKADENVIVYPMAITANPWVEAAYVEHMRTQMPEREFAQRFLALEQPPARATYPRFDRKIHIQPVPNIGLTDVTRQVTGADYLIGHDPGELHDVSLVLKAYERREVVNGERVLERLWYVMGELTTDQTTSSEHAAALAEYLSDRFRAHEIEQDRNGMLRLREGTRTVVIRADPHGTSEGTPDVAVYQHFRKLGFDIRPAQYKRNADAASASKAGTLKREARIETVNTLIRSAAGRTRLFILADSRGHPTCPKLAQALEMSQRDDYGRSEQQRKDSHDLSHWPSALGFALWPYERPTQQQQVMTDARY
jgi:hypothetical protein